MKVATTVIIAAVSLAGARAARHVAIEGRNSEEIIEPPYTPSPSAAPFVSLGYRELAADLLYIRLRGYYGGYYDTTADAVASLAETIVTLDPRYEYVYWFGASAMTIAPEGVDQSIYLRSVALLERGMREFPLSYKLTSLAAQTYIQDLKSEDPVQKRAWDERGTLLAESAIRLPGAPIESAGWVATLRTRLGQRDRAMQGLRELLLITTEERARKGLLERLANLEGGDSTEIAAELLEMRKRFDDQWTAERPSVKASMYILVGPPLPKAFDMTDLATGGRDLATAHTFERLEPLVDQPPAPGGPPAPTP